MLTTEEIIELHNIESVEEFEAIARDLNVSIQELHLIASMLEGLKKIQAEFFEKFQGVFEQSKQKESESLKNRQFQKTVDPRMRRKKGKIVWRK